VGVRVRRIFRQRVRLSHRHLAKKRYGNDVSVCYTEVSFLAQGGTRSPIVRLDGPLSVVIMDIDSHFEGAEVPTAWLKSRLAIEVER
jgi:hypothetical protein